MDNVRKKNLEDSFDNLTSAMESFEKCLKEPIHEDRDLAGIIKNFEFVYELTWKSLKHLLSLEGKEAYTPREVFEAAFEFNIIADEQIWPNIMKDRNLTVHTYDQKFANEMYERILKSYFTVFKKTHDVIKVRKLNLPDSLLTKHG